MSDPAPRPEIQTPDALDIAIDALQKFGSDMNKALDRLDAALCDLRRAFETMGERSRS